MTELLTAAQMRAIEQAAIGSGQVTGLELMERAGRGVVEAVFEARPELAATSHRAVVLCGPGNNGGDGFVVARLLRERGWEVEVFLYGDAEKLPPDARVNYERWKAVKLFKNWVQPWKGMFKYENNLVKKLTSKTFYKHSGNFKSGYADLYVDALFGTGLTRGIHGDIADVVRRLSGAYGENYQPRMVSIDAPSGLCLDSGRVLSGRDDNVINPDDVEKKYTLTGPSITPFSGKFAALTVTFDSPKIGHFIGNGPVACGHIKVVDIGLRAFRETQKRGVSPRRITRMADVSLIHHTPIVADSRHSLAEVISISKASGKADHKFTHGHALILSGASGKGGAARLAARGALRIGAGVVSVGCPREAVLEHACHLNAIMLREVENSAALEDALKDNRINALCIGPGLGQGRARELVPVALAGDRSVVLDADALSAYRDDPETLFARTRAHRCVLTPHAGEFSRLFPDIAKRLREEPMSGPAYSKVDATREAAKRAGCVVLFKGADTVIADPSGRCSINSAHYVRSAPWLATAGSGDVLAGFITGLMARGHAPMQAAQTAAWLHVECALRYGAGLIAEDIPEELPKVLNKLDN